MNKVSIIIMVSIVLLLSSLLSAEKISESDILKRFPNIEEHFDSMDYISLQGCYTGREFIRFYTYHDGGTKDGVAKKINIGTINIVFWKLNFGNNRYKWYRLVKQNGKRSMITTDGKGNFEHKSYRFTGRNTRVPAHMRSASMVFNGSSYRKTHCR